MQDALENVRVVAVRGAPRSGVPFDAAPVVGVSPDGTLFELERFFPGFVEGSELTEPQLLAAVAGGDATMLDEPVPAEAGHLAWIFESAQDAESAAAELGTAGAYGLRIPSGSGAILLVRRPECNEVRLAIHERRREAALVALRQRDQPRALQEATWAWLVASPVSALDVALLVAAHDAAGDARRAGALRAMEKRSHPPAFDRMVEEELARLRIPSPA